MRTASLAGVAYRVVAVPAGDGQALVIAQRLDPTQQVLTRLAVTLPLVGAIGVLLAALAGVAVARTGLRPVDRLTAATERIAATGDLHPIPVDGTDELARLTRSFNAMLGALAASQEQQRRLVADAGHELRTPLTSMRTNLELLAAANAARRTRAARVGARGDLRGRAGAGHGAVDAGRRPGRAGPRRRADGRARAGRAHRRDPAGSGARAAAGGRRRVRADARAVDADGRQHRPRARGAQPARQRREVESAGRSGAGADAPARRVVAAGRGRRRRARASRRRTCRTSSTASTGPTPPARCPAPAWGWRSCGRSRSGTAARCGRGGRRRAER